MFHQARASVLTKAMNAPWAISSPAALPPVKPLFSLSSTTLHLGKIFPGKAYRVVGRAVINQDDFAIGIALA